MLFNPFRNKLVHIYLNLSIIIRYYYYYCCYYYIMISISLKSRASSKFHKCIDKMSMTHKFIKTENKLKYFVFSTIKAY